MRRFIVSLCLVVLGLFFAGCAEGPAILEAEVVTAVTETPTLLPTSTLMMVTATAVIPTTTPIPTDTPVFTLAQAATPLPTDTPVPPTEHTVQAGESLVSIAIQYGISVEALAAANFLDDPELIYVGQILTLPRVAAVAVAPVQLSTVPNEPAIIGYSFLGRALEVYTFGTGPNTLIFVGGIHGGYEWNTTVLAYEMIDHLLANPDLVPTAVTLHIIPAANPDGIYSVTGKNGRITANDITTSDTFPARFNARNVDLNRNWDCNWSATAYWRDQPVNPGSAPFSEIETQLLRDFFISQQQLKAVIFWHSQATIVAPGSCGETHQPSNDIASVYARAANYTLQAFAAYQINGDASDWLAKTGIPSFAVELSTHQSTDWERNLAGVQALLTLFQE